MTKTRFRDRRETGEWILKPDAQDSLGRQALLAEYTALRAEATSLTQEEISTAAATFSFIAAILGLNFFLGGTNEDATQFMTMGICPLTAMFFGVLWMNIFYRKARTGAYLFLLEKDINRDIAVDHQKVYWEHWLLIQSAGRTPFTKVGQFYDYVAFGAWLISPAIVFICAHFLFPAWELLWPTWNLKNLFLAHRWFGYFLLAILFIYMYVMIGMCVGIVKLKKMDRLQSQVRTAGFLFVEGKQKSKPKKGRCAKRRKK